MRLKSAGGKPSVLARFLKAHSRSFRPFFIVVAKCHGDTPTPMQNQSVTIMKTEIRVERVRSVQIKEYTINEEFMIERRRHE